MKIQIDQVTDFHRKIGAEVGAKPRLLSSDREAVSEIVARLRNLIRKAESRRNPNATVIARGLMAIEELAEWFEAHADGDLNAAADAWADRCYLLFGDAVAAGLPAEQLFEAVHQSNMTKSPPGSSTGKGIKSEGFRKPEIHLGSKE